MTPNICAQLTSCNMGSLPARLSRSHIYARSAAVLAVNSKN